MSDTKSEASCQDTTTVTFRGFGEISIVINKYNEIVIKQSRWDGDDDNYVVIPDHLAEAVAAAISDLYKKK